MGEFMIQTQKTKALNHSFHFKCFIPILWKKKVFEIYLKHKDPKFYSDQGFIQGVKSKFCTLNPQIPTYQHNKKLQNRIT